MTAVTTEGAVEPAFLRLLTPDHHYLAGEAITFFFHPAGAAAFDVRITAGRDREVVRRTVRGSRFERAEGLDPGRYQARVRWSPQPAAAEAWWSPWSVPCAIEVHPAAEADLVTRRRIWSHRHSLIAERDIHGILTITDPWGWPPSCPRVTPTKWFRTAVYEGATTLLDEDESYYRDPSAYLLGVVDTLAERGVRFVTWHDLLAGVRVTGPAGLLQFDVDAGRHSIARLLPRLLERNVRATLMIHREAHDWYEYQVEDLPLELFDEAERAGWAIGYHQNAVGNTQRLDRSGDYGPGVMEEAADRFREDVKHLRTRFDIRTCTSHGGNVLNHRLETPPDVDICCVDRINAGLWKPIRSMFSDGGFAARPCPLREKIAAVAEGIHFFRLHPIKYGNYEPPWDAPPLVEEDVASTGVEPSAEIEAWRRREREKQRVWLEHRRRHRLGRRFSYAGIDKPISRRFRPVGEIASLVERFRARRKAFFLREYPAAEGDPRVFWWRMLDAFVPTRGEVLNVGALPPASRDETTAFLDPEVRVVEMDIDPGREPHVVGDVTDPPAALRGRFRGVLLFGLPYVHSPGRAIDACGELVAGGGVGLFGFPDDTHPMRGAVWNATGRPRWRRALEPLTDIGLQGNLWSFDEACLDDLFRAWPSVVVENFSHYWFVVAGRAT